MRTTDIAWRCSLAAGLWVVVVVVESSTASSATTTPPMHRTAEFPLLDQLFPHQSINGAWERYALLSKGRLATEEEAGKFSAEKEQDDETCINATIAGTIPTVFVPPQSDNGALTEAERLALAQSLLDLEDAIPSIVPYHQKRGNKLDLARRFDNGSDVDFYFDHQPKHLQRLKSWEQTHEIVFEQNYTLILLGLQLEHSPIARFANFLHHDSCAHYTTCNMYLTPPGAAGFARHLDWMDVVVVQVSGRKLWRVAREPTNFLSTYDETTLLGEITDEHGVVSYEEFVMEPGDVLYIPRGVVHNATTPNDGIAEDEPSLHLTFGIEHEGFTTFEGLLQHAAALFGEETPNFHNGVKVEFAEGCVDAEENDGSEDWIILLSLAIARVARLDCDRCRAMRQSVPRNEGWKQVYTQRVKARAGKGTDESFSFEQALTLDYENMIHLLAEETTLKETLSFTETLYEEQLDEIFSFATQPEELEIEDLECYVDGEIDEETFSSILTKFVSFALENQQAAVERFETKVKEEDDDTVIEDNKWIEKKWGHTRECNADYPLFLRFANQSFDCQEE